MRWLRSSGLAVAVLSVSTAAHAQTVFTWGGGFPNDKFNIASNWYGDATPPSDGTATLQFTSDSESTLVLVAPVSIAGISALVTSSGSDASIFIGGASALTIGSGGITATTGDTAGSADVTIQGPIILAANQTWSSTFNTQGAITTMGAISGSFGLTLAGDPYSETFALMSGASTFTGGVNVSGAGSANTTLVIGASSTGPAGAPTSGPVGTGTLTLGDGSTLTTTTTSQITLANPISAGDSTSGNSIVFGGSTNRFGSLSNSLLLTGPVTLEDLDIELDAGANSTVTFAGNLNGFTSGVCLDFGSPGTSNSVVIVQGNITNVDRLDLEDNVSVILDGASPSQISGISDIGSTSSNYLGVGRGYSASGDVTSFLAYMNSSGSAANFGGTLGFDTTSGATVTFNDPIDLTNFASGGFSGLGSATQAVLSSTAVITPPGGAAGALYPFGGGGGTLTVQSPLSDGSGARGLSLGSGNGPLTLILSGSLSYTGGTSVNGGVLVFDTPPPASGPWNLNSGYLGATTASGYSDVNGNVQNFIDKLTSGASGVVGFDSLSSQQMVTSDIDLSETGSALFLGTATSVLYSGNITPYNREWRFSGVKGGQVEVSSTLSDNTNPYSVVVGLQTPVESFSQTFGFQTVSSVTLSGNNSYSGGTVLNSGYLYVTNDNSLGTGPLAVPGNLNVNGWAATLAVSPSAVGPVTLSNAISIQENGLALNTGGSQLLTLTGDITDIEGAGQLGIFGPVTLTGDNNYTGGTFIQGAAVTIGSDTGLGWGAVNVQSSTLNFTSATPVLDPLRYNEVYLNGTTATFAGTAVLNELQMDQTTLNFNGPAALISGMFDDSPGSGNVMNLGSTTQLTIDTYNPEDGNYGTNYHGTITGLGSLVLINTGTDGTGSLDLRGANTYSGGTTVGPNTVVIASNNSALGTGPVTISPNGGVATNTGVTVTNPINLIDGGALAGYGTYSPGTNITFQNTSILDPGSALLDNGGGGNHIPVPGLLAFGGGTSLTFGQAGRFVFAISDANGAAGAGYSSVNMPGETLNITATSGNPFTIGVFSYDPGTNMPGLAANFNPTLSYSWTLVAAGSITGFNANDFTFNTAGFENSTGSGGFFVSQSGNDLMLNFTPVPEPSTWMLMASGICALGAAIRRRRR